MYNEEKTIQRMHTYGIRNTIMRSNALWLYTKDMNGNNTIPSPNGQLLASKEPTRAQCQISSTDEPQNHGIDSPPHTSNPLH